MLSWLSASIFEEADSLQFQVHYTDAAAAKVARTYSMTLPRFIKHFVLAGAGFTPTAPLLARGLGAVAWYWTFLAPLTTGESHFGEPIPVLRDPTLKAHFSNLAGRALADFLGREIEQAWATFSYEGVLIASGLPLTGQRPDLLAVNPLRVVAIEAKGYRRTSVSPADMLGHKFQAGTGPLSKDSWAASVAYALYDSVKVNYLDPTDEREPPSLDFTLSLLGGYFQATRVAVQELPREQRRIEGRDVWAMPLRDVLRGRVPLDVDAADVLNRVELLVDRDDSKVVTIFKRLREQKDDKQQRAERRPVERPPVVDTESVFLDADGIGIALATI